ncbi:MAG TPA: PQQ-binding-like beta-propeller repeat protein [Gemmataceae bacterium]|nr:PQQ-binding-like beta-propeller repeat protein [Gemmataceae bacterium]
MYRTALALLLLPAVASGADWPGWRGPQGNGLIPDTNLPVHWSATENVRWKVPLHLAGVSAPVVGGDRIFLTACDGRLNDQLHVLCYRRQDGRELWHTRLFGSALSDGQFAPGGMAVPTPATDGKHLFVLFGTGDLASLDREGNPVWVRSLAAEYGPFRNRWGMAASPRLTGDLLVIQVDHWGQSYLLGIDARTGANRWKTNRDAAVNWTSPVLADVRGRKQIIASGTYKVKGYDAETGAELWSVRGLQMQCIPTPTVVGQTAYAVSGLQNYTLAIRLDGSRGDLTGTHIVWKARAGATYTCSPVCDGRRYYFVEDNGWGNCLDAATGKRVWRERMDGNFRASLLAGDGKVYFTSLEGVVTVVRTGPKFDVLARNELGESIVATPAVAGGMFFIRGDKHLYCIGPTQAK